MVRSLALLVALVLVLLTSPARADIRQCHVFNNTDHVIGHMGIRPGQSWWILPGTFKVQDHPGKQVLEIACDAKTPVLKLVGTRDAVTIERLPAWLELKLDGNTNQLTVTAKKQGAVIELDGVPLALKQGTATHVLDIRARLLAADPITSYDPDQRGWYLPMSFKATAGNEKAELFLIATSFKAGRELLEEVRRVKTAPLSWAAAPDHAGPAILSGCAFEGFVLLRNPRTLTEISLIASCERRDVQIETCPPSKDRFAGSEEPRIIRYRRDIALELVEAKTGKVIATTTLKGRTPGPCRDTATKPIMGDEVSKSEVLEWMNTVK